MKIIVLGAGILGTTTAWFLRQDGHEVTVVDRQPGAGLETSYANGSQISVSYAEPWANPGAPMKILKWLGKEDSPLLFRLNADPHQWMWGLSFLANCTPARTRFNTIQLTNLGIYSRNTLGALRKSIGIRYDELERGIMHLYESDSEFDAARPGLELMREFGCRMDFLDPDAIVALEPALAAYKSRLAGAAYAPEDESGDAFLFTKRLAEMAAAQGVTFRYGTQVVTLKSNGDRLAGVVVKDGHANGPGREETLLADAYVMSLGSWSAQLLRDVGVSTLIYPAKGYSATLPIRPGATANTVSLTDHQLKIVFSRLGDRIRIAGTAELSGYGTELKRLRCEALTKRAEEIFPGVLDVSKAEFWAGLRPATPSNVPYIGRSKLGTCGSTPATGRSAGARGGIGPCAGGPDRRKEAGRGLRVLRALAFSDAESLECMAFTEGRAAARHGHARLEVGRVDAPERPPVRPRRTTAVDGKLNTAGLCLSTRFEQALHIPRLARGGTVLA